MREEAPDNHHKGEFRGKKFLNNIEKIFPFFSNEYFFLN
jgi:hypothetical protein